MRPRKASPLPEPERRRYKSPYSQEKTSQYSSNLSARTASPELKNRKSVPSVAGYKEHNMPKKESRNDLELDKRLLALKSDKGYYVEEPSENYNENLKINRKSLAGLDRIQEEDERPIRPISSRESSFSKSLMKLDSGLNDRFSGSISKNDSNIMHHFGQEGSRVESIKNKFDYDMSLKRASSKVNSNSKFNEERPVGGSSRPMNRFDEERPVGGSSRPMNRFDENITVSGRRSHVSKGQSYSHNYMRPTTADDF